jgi:hypothetical protein
MLKPASGGEVLAGDAVAAATTIAVARVTPPITSGGSEVTRLLQDDAHWMCGFLAQIRRGSALLVRGEPPRAPLRLPLHAVCCFCAPATPFCCMRFEKLHRVETEFGFRK